jgi:hypothetical protein
MNYFKRPIFIPWFYTIATNVQGLAMWRYSVLHKPGLVLIKDMKLKYILRLGFIRQLDMALSSEISIRIYSLSRHIAKPLVVC